jgi:hypothetical protein
MKGVIFTTFLEMVEDKFGYETVDEIITKSDLPTKGVYTSVGTYSHHEIVRLVVELSKSSGVPIETLLRVYGKHLFGILANAYKGFFENVDNSFDFMQGIENYIHVEVKKLYPDAELPHFVINRTSEYQMDMLYTSERKMGDLAYGLMEGCIEHFNETVHIDMAVQNEEQTQVKFVLTKTV